MADKIEIPAVGEHDWIVPPHIAEELQKKIVNGQIMVLGNAVTIKEQNDPPQRISIPDVGEPKRLGVIGVLSDYSEDVFKHFGEKVTEIKRDGDIVYYLAEHGSFAEMTGHAVIPFYSFFVNPYCLKGVWDNPPFGVAWDSDGFRIVENQPNN